MCSLFGKPVKKDNLQWENLFIWVLKITSFFSIPNTNFQGMNILPSCKFCFLYVTYTRYAIVKCCQQYYVDAKLVINSKSTKKIWNLIYILSTFHSKQSSKPHYSLGFITLIINQPLSVSHVPVQLLDQANAQGMEIALQTKPVSTGSVQTHAQALVERIMSVKSGHISRLAPSVAKQRVSVAGHVKYQKHLYLI